MFFPIGKDHAKLRADLINIAKTTLSSKLLKHEKDHFATLAVDAVLRLQGRPNLDYIQVIKKAGIDGICDLLYGICDLLYL